MFTLSATVGVYNVIFHDHHHARRDMPYLKLRNKPFPWSCNDCDLADLNCWAECKGTKKKDDGHHNAH